MWRRVFRLISCVCVCVWLMCGVGKIEVSAIASGMESVSLTELEKQEFIDNLCIEMVPGDTARWPIQCFDIREDGTIALAIDSNIIYVYDPSGRRKSFQRKI